MEEFLQKYMSETPAKFISDIVPVLVVFIACIIIIKLLMRIVRRTIKKTKLQKGLYTFVERTTQIILYFIATLIIADMLNIPITSLLAAFSVVGLAVSLAVQDTLSNLVGGIGVLTTHPFKLGDWVDIAGTSGTVTEINFIHTLLTTIDNKVIHLPNKDVINATITNYSESEYRKVCISFDVSYKNKMNEVLDTMKMVVDNTPNIINEKEIFCKVTAYKDSSIEYTIRAWTKNEKYWEVYFYLLEKIKLAFDEKGIEIPYNQLDVHVHNN